VPVRFCDLPAAHQLAPPAGTEAENSEGENSEGGGSEEGGSEGEAAEDEGPGEDGSAPDPAGGIRLGPVGGLARAGGERGREEGGSEGEAAEDEGPGEDGSAPDPAEGIRLDPLGWLARAAGYDDAERWWDDVVEHRGGGPSPFPAIAEAMAELRARLAELPEGAATAGLPPGHLRREEQREAHMRRTLRRTLKEGHDRVAVVCGAWHVPALKAKVPAAHDDRTLRGLPRTKVAMTWVP